jgi:hypothetical protein
MWQPRIGLSALGAIANHGASAVFLAGLRKAAAAADADRQFMLGYVLSHQDVPEWAEAERWLELAARAEHADALFALAITRADAATGRLRWGSPATESGRAFLMRAAEAGSADAQRTLACCLAVGDPGFEKNAVAARAWHTRAAEQDLRESQYDVGMMWLDGEGGPENREQGLAWLTLGADGPVTDAGTRSCANALAGIYRDGSFGVRKNGSREERYKMRTAAADSYSTLVTERADPPTANAIALVEEALLTFPLAPYRGRIVSHECDECARVETDFANRRWIDLAVPVVEYHKDSLPLLTPEALAALAPAFLVGAFTHPTGELAEIAGPSLRQAPAKATSLSPADVDLLARMVASLPDD